MKIGKQSFFSQVKEMLRAYEEYRPQVRTFFSLLYENPLSLYQTLGINTDQLEILYKKATELYKNGHHKEACKLFQLLTLCNGGEPKYLLGLAASQHLLKEYQTAAFLYTACSLRDPENPAYAFHASDCYAEMDDPLSALLACKQAINAAGEKPPYQALKKKCELSVQTIEREIKTAGREKAGQENRDFLQEALAETEALQKRILSLSRENPSKEEEKRQRAYANIAKEAEALSQRWKKGYTGRDLTLLGPLLFQAKLMSATLAMGVGSPALLVTLSTTLPTLFCSETKGGWIGNEFEKLLETTHTALLQIVPERLNCGTQQMIRQTTTLLLLLFTLVLLHIDKEGMGHFAQANIEKEEAHTFTLELMLHLFLEAKIVQDVLEALLPYFTDDPKRRPLLSSLLELLFTTTALTATSRGTEKRLATFAESIGSYLKQQLDRLDKDLEELITSRVLNRETISPFSLLLQQARMQVDKGQWDAFSATLKKTMETLQISPKGLQNNFVEMKEALEEYLSLLKGDGKEGVFADIPLII